MKLCRFGQPGQEKPGLVSEDGTIRDLSGVVDDITVETLARARAADPATLPVVEGTPRYGVPVNGIGKIVAIGLNYEDHAIESNLPIPTEPMMFMKAVSSLNGPNDPVMLPQDASHGDWEVELGVIIGRTCRYVSEDEALDRVAGYVLANDVSERFNQKQRGTQWSKGKGHDTFCPVGPWLVTPDEVGDPQDLDMHLDVNGQRMQTGNTRTMIFTIRQLIAYVSRYITLYPGDLLITGTPPGVGEGKKPQAVYLKAGDVMELGIAGLGTQRQDVIAWRDLGEGVPA
ncbi:fumarylacetoacetate hydrolase family protein [Sphingomonas carotinifaciens]|uniref:2-hydroxyhepta-2,4-diene-1,7-dioate isomerase n=1 Tax=Sphingomonas carotinifaciens TaxID=1166323 RepID=A0A1G7HXK8_9SPHN|nr:fumarylacetoacetate hydrolase family protein [Sphingomonas carotinifaciens]MBB4085091.1 2-keto-4-pentenoate hydratase/2-oxohepta-3-ene-1,7-dioic acid hydratase in catechol pathway [Sphingomonas carotinifaciens]MWC44469.1 2-hydroxyhepta-2,4-diene-1,7-dioate isomerase [Sphingomonas carotinifaciens]SDF04854.1 2-keto-4-pentenoate hydratase/2-oxohepta-3-ene-1,7-dioic acid hydratase (catechol pathway) [Sphingomonas carotinifaciens]